MHWSYFLGGWAGQGWQDLHADLLKNLFFFFFFFFFFIFPLGFSFGLVVRERRCAVIPVVLFAGSTNREGSAQEETRLSKVKDIQTLLSS